MMTYKGRRVSSGRVKAHNKTTEQKQRAKPRLVESGVSDSGPNSQEPARLNTALKGPTGKTNRVPGRKTANTAAIAIKSTDHMITLRLYPRPAEKFQFWILT